MATVRSKAFDNRHRNRNVAHHLYIDAPRGAMGMRFQDMVLDPEVGSEIVLLLLDPSGFGLALASKSTLDIRLKIASIDTSGGTLLVLLWWFPPVKNGKPLASNEHYLNPTGPETFNMLRRLESQTHLHVLLIGGEGRLLNLFECPNTFGFEEAVPIARAACAGPPLDFDRAKRDYEARYRLEDFFENDEDLEEQNDLERETDDISPERGSDSDEEEFLLRPETKPLIESAAYLAARLLESPERTDEERRALAKALYALVRLPKPTQDLNVTFGIRREDSRGNLRYWEIEFCETDICFKVGGSVNGPLGHDSYTSFRYSLFIGGEDSPNGDFFDWYSFQDLIGDGDPYRVFIDDDEDPKFWSRVAP